MHNHNGRHAWWMMLGCLLPLGALLFRDYIPGKWLGPLVILLMVGMHIPMFFGGKKEPKQNEGTDLSDNMALKEHSRHEL